MIIKNFNLFKLIYYLSLTFCTINICSDIQNELVVPKGFQISIFASNLDSPRQITETKSGAIVVGSKKGSEIVALLDENNDGIFEKDIIVANNLQNPAGVTYFKGDLYIAEMDTI